MNLLLCSPSPIALRDSVSSVVRLGVWGQVSQNPSCRNGFVSGSVVSPRLRLTRRHLLVCGLGGSLDPDLKSEADCRVEKLDRREELGAVESARSGSESISEEVTMGDLLDLEKQFSFYGAYHNNKVNIFIHILFVWPIFFTNEILWAYTPALAPLPLAGGTLPFQQYMVLNGSFVIAAIYALYYIALDKKAGSLGAAICLGCWIAGNAVAQALSWSVGWKVVLAAQLTCWIGQVYGHQKFEGRAPALLDNVAQAMLMAPFFVLLECLQSFGYEPYPGFHKRVQRNVDDAIREFRARKQPKKTA